MSTAPTSSCHAAPGRRHQLLAGAAGSLLVTVSLGSAFLGAGTHASIDPSLASLDQVQQVSGGGRCWADGSRSSCTSTNVYGAQGMIAKPLVPGQTVSTTIHFDSHDSGATRLVLSPARCTASTGTGSERRPVRTDQPTRDLCSVLRVALHRGSRATGIAAYDGSLAGFGTPRTFRVDDDPTFTFVVTLPSTATSAVQGQQVSQPLSWAFQK